MKTLTHRQSYTHAQAIGNATVNLQRDGKLVNRETINAALPDRIHVHFSGQEPIAFLGFPQFTKL